MDYSKLKKIMIIVLLLDILLVATNKGEFWPFSIYPMFSQAGHPWTRAVVERVADKNKTDLWKTKPLKDIRNHIVSMKKYGVYQIDYANYISKTDEWDHKRIQGLRDVFRMSQHPGQMWVITRVTGYISGTDTVAVDAVPLFLFTADTTYKNPHIFSQ